MSSSPDRVERWTIWRSWYEDAHGSWLVGPVPDQPPTVFGRYEVFEVVPEAALLAAEGERDWEKAEASRFMAERDDAEDAAERAGESRQTAEKHLVEVRAELEALARRVLQLDDGARCSIGLTRAKLDALTHGAQYDDEAGRDALRRGTLLDATPSKDRCPTCGSSNPWFTQCNDLAQAEKETGRDFSGGRPGCGDAWHDQATPTQPAVPAPEFRGSHAPACELFEDDSEESGDEDCSRPDPITESIDRLFGTTKKQPAPSGEWPRVTVVRSRSGETPGLPKAYVNEEPPYSYRTTPEIWECRTYVPAEPEGER